MTREAGIQIIGYFMIGSPGENLDTIRKTIDLAKKLKLDFAQFAVTTAFPGTALWDQYLKDNRSDICWQDFIYWGGGARITPVFETSNLDRKALQYWVKRAHKEFYLRPAYIGQRIRSIRSPKDIMVNVKGFSMLLGNVR